MTNLPMVFNEAEMVDETSKLVAIVAEKMTAASTREFLETELRSRLRQGTIDELQITEAADNGDEIADAALRKVYAEKVNRRETPSIHLTSYAIKALESGPVKRGRGHVWYDNWRRDYVITVLVFMTIYQFELVPTRNREQRRRGQPSASSIVAAALGRHHINVTEKTVENLWGALQGHVWRHLLAGTEFESPSNPPI